MIDAEATLGNSVPADTPHAVSVSLPTWRANVGYEEGQDWVVSKMQTGYPRFFIHKSIASFAELIVAKHGRPGEHAMLISSHLGATRCVDFIRARATAHDLHNLRVLDFVRSSSSIESSVAKALQFSAVVYPENIHPYAKTYWQHSGEGVSSRRAEYCRKMFEEGVLVEKGDLEEFKRPVKGPKRYRRPDRSDSGVLSADGNGHNGNHVNGNGDADLNDGTRFLEERFGRNLNLDLADDAKKAIKRRIAGSLITDTELGEALQLSPDTGNQRNRHFAVSPEEDVYLYSCGMNSIYNTHRSLLAARGEMKSICFGFPYIDTLKILEKFGPGCLFYGKGSSEDLDDLEKRLQSGERYLALFTEFPSNPLLRTPDIRRIKTLADKYDFAVIVDETVGNFLNVHVLPYADVLVSSLTKIFSGDSNVMGGSAIFNPKGQYHDLLKRTWATEYEDMYWPEDAIFMERNSRDFVARIARVNTNAEAVCDLLSNHPKIKRVYYPKVNPSKMYYDQARTQNGGYGGLLSTTFHSIVDAAAFFDNLDFAKGPSLGTNFTLVSPFVILAHFTELEWAAQYGVEANLVRFSFGLEDTAEMLRRLQHALDCIP